MLIIDLIRWKMSHHSIIEYFCTDINCSFGDDYDDELYEDYDTEVDGSSEYD